MESLIHPLYIGYADIYGKETIGIYSEVNNNFHYLTPNNNSSIYCHLIKNINKESVVKLYSIATDKHCSIEFILLSIYGYNKETIKKSITIYLNKFNDKIYLLLDKNKINKINCAFVVKEDKYALKLNIFDSKEKELEELNIYGYIKGKGFVYDEGFLNKSNLKDKNLYIEVVPLEQVKEVTAEELLLMVNSVAPNNIKYALKK